MSMLSLGKHGPDGIYGAVVDVGSGSVGVAIVASEPKQSAPEIIWSHRELTNIKDIESLQAASKDITTAIINAFLELGSKGGKALRKYDPKASITDIQVTISAPWSYTISKTVSFEDKETFKVTTTLFEDLETTAKKEIQAVLDSNEVMKKLGLQVVAESTRNVTANGYLINEPNDQMVTTLSLSHIDAVCEERMITVIEDAKEKVFPRADLRINTFANTFYNTLTHLNPESTEICLVDITAEATELGIVRDSTLQYVTHIPYGTHTLAREISGLCGIPKSEALAYIRNPESTVSIQLPDAKRLEFTAIIKAYEEKLADLFKRTGDSLSIPKTIYLHTDVATESFFKDRITGATQQSTKTSHAIHLITSKLFATAQTSDTAILLSAFVFHKINTDPTFKL